MKRFVTLSCAAIFFAAVLSLHAADTTAPAIANVAPSPGGTVSNLTRVAITFSEPVTGPEAEDFLINGSPASGRSGASNVWTFTFSQPAAGPVMFGWDGSRET